MSRNHVRVIVIKDGKLLCMKRDKFGQKYYVLIGGGVDLGETKEAALHREVAEETGLKITNLRHVFNENAGKFYGKQQIYLADLDPSGGDEPALSPDSIEAKISAAGKNTYEPEWLPLSQISKVSFRSSSLEEAIVEGLKTGWPTEVQELDWKAERSQLAGGKS